MWLACEKYQKQPVVKLPKEAQKINDNYLEVNSPHEVGCDNPSS